MSQERCPSCSYEEIELRMILDDAVRVECLTCGHVFDLPMSHDPIDDLDFGLTDEEIGLAAVEVD